MNQPISEARIEAFRLMTSAQRNRAVAQVLLGDAPEDVEREVLAYRAALVTRLREENLWPGPRGRSPRDPA